jgi:hypothetical protein
LGARKGDDDLYMFGLCVLWIAGVERWWIYIPRLSYVGSGTACHKRFEEREHHMTAVRENMFEVWSHETCVQASRESFGRNTQEEPRFTGPRSEMEY